MIGGELFLVGGGWARFTFCGFGWLWIDGCLVVDGGWLAVDWAGCWWKGLIWGMVGEVGNHRGWLAVNRAGWQ